MSSILSQSELVDLMLERMRQEDCERELHLTSLAHANGLQVESLPSGILLALTPLETVKTACSDWEQACSIVHELLSEKARYPLAEREGWVKTAQQKITAAQVDMRLATADLLRLIEQSRQASSSLACW